MTISSEAKGNIIGVVIVSYCSGDVLLECLESVLSSHTEDVRIVICDNASTDDTVAKIHSWAKGNIDPQRSTASPLPPQHPIPKPIDLVEFSTTDDKFLHARRLAKVTLLKNDKNLGFAGGVNTGLSFLLPHSNVDLFWILNPDCLVLPETALEFRKCAMKNMGFGLMGGRIIYMEPPNYIQTDGGRVSQWTGVCRNINQGKFPASTPFPHTSDIDFIPGASIVASRVFIDKAGLMSEDYFLYYEEVDWASRTGEMPLIICQNSIVYHHGGTSIGSGSFKRLPTAFSYYFNFRSRIRYMMRFNPINVIISFSYTSLAIIKLILSGHWSEAHAATRGMLNLSPPPAVANRISDNSSELAFKKRGHLEKAERAR